MAKWPKDGKVKEKTEIKKDVKKMVKSGKAKPVIEPVDQPELNVSELKDKISDCGVVTPDIVRQLQNNKMIR